MSKKALNSVCVLCIVIWVKNGRELILMWATDRKFHLQKNTKGLNCERRGGDYILNWRKVEERGGCREKQPLRRVGLTKALKTHQDSLKASIKTNAKKDDCRLKNFQFPSNFLLEKSPFFVGIVPLNMQIKSRRATSIIEFHMEMPNSKHEK